jgi:signal transduction histidine kinase
MDKPAIFLDVEMETLLKISNLAVHGENWKDQLDQIIQYTRPYFIFDNVVIYYTEIESDRVEVLYARATGRGKNRGADVSWGETVSNKVINEKKTIIEVPDNPEGTDRLLSPYILGLPLSLSTNLIGALIFVRFGGPEYKPESIRVAEFLAEQVSSVVQQKCLEDLERVLQAQRDITRLQGDFINTISHELRNPLGFIKGYTTTLLREDAHWDKNTQHDFLEIIERETNNLTELIDNLLDSSRLQSGRMHFDFQMLRIETIIQNEAERAAITHPAQIVKLNIPEKLPAIRGDARRLAQVFANLFGNSHKYAPESEINIKVYSTESTIQIEYSDTGPGIQEKYLPFIFTRFFRDPDQSIKVHGSGLGLSICKQIIESHSGKISVDSPKGSGALFTISLPLNEAPIIS